MPTEVMIVIGLSALIFSVAVVSFVLLLRSLGRKRSDKRPSNPYRSVLRDPD